MMQIRKIVLYGINGKVRCIPFNLGEVNIISGKSKTGKSVIGDIVDYCMGGDSCNIADGIVRETVLWYGLLLQLENERIFVARQSPPKGNSSTSKFYYNIGKKIDVPRECDFEPNTNTEGIEEMLSLRLGIKENINIPPEGQTRNPLVANIRHSLFYCLQNQDEIAAKNFLFHNQSKSFVTQAIKDTMPYFLGIVNEKTLELENERIAVKRKLAIEKRSLEEDKMIQGGGLSRAIELITEAEAVGLTKHSSEVDYEDYYSVKKKLDDISMWNPEINDIIANDDLSSFQQKYLNNENTIEEISENISSAKKFVDETYGYSEEMEQQKVRLQSIGLFEKLNFETDKCPLCSAKLENPLPSVEGMKNAVKNLESNIAYISREKPKLQSYIAKLEKEKQNLKEENKVLKSKIDGILLHNKDSNTLKDLNSRQAKVVGRISLWLESVVNKDVIEGKEKKVLQLTKRLEEIDKLLDKDAIEERKQSILNRMSVEMTKWANELELEYADNPYRLDMNKVTVVVDKPERAVPLQQLGSGSNWLGVHLITYFALHKYFISLNRPVPNFLIIDQPSQVYFPSDVDEEDTDTIEVKKLYDFIFKRVEELKGKMQVIIVDHAYIKNEKFEGALRQDWWHGDKLVPEEWILNEK